MSERLFIAIELGAEVRNRLAALQDELRRTPAKVRWVAPEGIHLTLAFLGDTDAERAELVRMHMDEVVPPFVPFSITVTGLGYFGRPDSPRVVWAGCGAEGTPLEALQAGLATGLRSMEFAIEERRYVPHLTLGRVKARDGAAALVRAVESHGEDELGAVVVQRVVLVRSDLSPAGPCYTVVHASTLGSTP